MSLAGYSCCPQCGGPLDTGFTCTRCRWSRYKADPPANRPPSAPLGADAGLSSCDCHGQVLCPSATPPCAPDEPRDVCPNGFNERAYSGEPCTYPACGCPMSVVSAEGTALDFGLAHDLRAVTAWIVERHVVSHTEEPLATINRAIDRLRGTAQERWAKHDLEWLLRNDAFVSTIAAHIGKYMERHRAAPDEGAREGDVKPYRDARELDAAILAPHGLWAHCGCSMCVRRWGRILATARLALAAPALSPDVSEDAELLIRRGYAAGGVRLRVDVTVPANEVWIQQGGEIVGRFTLAAVEGQK